MMMRMMGDGDVNELGQQNGRKLLHSGGEVGSTGSGHGC